MIQTEYNKTKEVAKKIGVDDWMLLIQSNCESTYKMELPPKCAIIDKDSFNDIYGEVYSSRAQFSAGRLYIIYLKNSLFLFTY